MSVQSSSLPEPSYATDLEVHLAIQSLSVAAKNRLAKTSASLFTGMGHKQFGRGPMDFLQEAIVLTLMGKRHWNKRMSFETYLSKTMLNIATKGKRRKKEPTIVLKGPVQYELDADPSEEEGEPFVETAASPYPDPERILAAQQRLNRAIENVADIPDASKVIQLVSEGWTASQIGQELGRSVLQVETLLKRIRDRSRKMLIQGEL